MSMQLEVEQHSRPQVGDDAREKLLAGVPVAERRLELAGVSTAILEGGDGTPVVLLHGPGEFAAKWMRVLPDLVTTNRVAAPDLPGHGTSMVVEGSLDAERVFAWLDELIEHTCSSPPVLVGHLLGGSIAARFAADRSDRLSQLVLVDSFGLGRFRPAPSFMLALGRFVARPTEHSYERFMDHCLADRDGVREQIGDQWVSLRDYSLDLARTPSVKAAMRFYMRQLGVPRIPHEELARITVPTSLIWGRHDRGNRLRIAEAASAGYGWPLSVIEHAADDPAMDQPEAFLEALRAAPSSV